MEAIGIVGGGFSLSLMKSNKSKYTKRRVYRASVPQQAIAYVDELLAFLALCDTVAWIGQTEYKEDVFRLFKKIFKAGYCGTQKTKPNICATMIENHAKSSGWMNSKAINRRQHLRDICEWWDEWVYAWCRNPPPRAYLRRTRSVRMS